MILCQSSTLWSIVVPAPVFWLEGFYLARQFFCNLYHLASADTTLQMHSTRILFVNFHNMTHQFLMPPLSSYFYIGGSDTFVSCTPTNKLNMFKEFFLTVGWFTQAAVCLFILHNIVRLFLNAEAYIKILSDRTHLLRPKVTIKSVSLVTRSL